MKKTILLSSLIAATTLFANGFDVKAGAEYSYATLNGKRAHVVGMFVEGEYSHEVYQINDKLAVEVAGGADLGVKFGRITLDNKEFVTIAENNAKLLKNFYEANKDKEKAAVKAELDKKENAAVKKLVKKLLGAEEDKYTIENIKKEADKEPAKYKGDKNQSVFVFSADAFALPKLVYTINQDIKVSGGVKLGLGYEMERFFGKEISDLKVDVREKLTTKYKVEDAKKDEEKTRKDAADELNKLNEAYLVDKNKKLDKDDFEVEDIDGDQAHKNLVLKDTVLSGNAAKLNQEMPFKLEAVTTHSLRVPFAAVIGVNYKNILGTVEFGGVYKYGFKGAKSGVDATVKLGAGYAF
ncbi:hypothetical protein [Oceanivirga miroungae]|uniref:Uncharacterized protein n=1 Tax=Oceanivirga miroungae TaxID=1130046 RepID=A0A6I8M8T2_9FUSO|nr:hypothetical protein [Oceanivirga miroungae]VWL85225.1 hypothetical protein OMES3154_00508 [Oceanivirga miroungae]